MRDSEGSCPSPSALPWPQNPKAWSERLGEGAIIYLGQELEKGTKPVKNQLWYQSLSPPPISSQTCSTPLVPELTAMDTSTPPSHSLRRGELSNMLSANIIKEVQSHSYSKGPDQLGPCPW